ncbi:MAG: class I SAM-dependent methyltransferase [Candidatus Hodarchaeota archaeon]
MNNYRIKLKSCPLCGNEKLNFLFYGIDRLLNKQPVVKGEKYGICKCKRCNFVFTNPRVPKNRINLYYCDSYPFVIDQRSILNLKPEELHNPFQETKKAIFSQVYGFDFFNSHLPSFSKKKLQYLSRKRKYRFNMLDFDGENRKVLDIGCGIGTDLCILKSRNWDARGIEQSETAVEICRKRNLLVIRGDILSVEINDLFHVVTLNHVLEHLYHPKKVLKRIHDILEPGGALLIQIPRMDSIFPKIFRSYWFPLDLPRHVSHFSKHIVTKLLEDIGFRIISCFTYSGSYEIINSIEYFFREKSKKGMPERIKRYLDDFIYFGSTRILDLLQLGLTLKII